MGATGGMADGVGGMESAVAVAVGGAGEGGRPEGVAAPSVDWACVPAGPPGGDVPRGPDAVSETTGELQALTRSSSATNRIGISALRSKVFLASRLHYIPMGSREIVKDMIWNFYANRPPWIHGFGAFRAAYPDSPRCSLSFTRLRRG